MGGDYRKLLYRNFNQKSTDELIEIWQSNNRVEWSETTFDVIREILLQRVTELPSQNEPITEETYRAKFEEQDENLIGCSLFSARLDLELALP